MKSSLGASDCRQVGELAHRIKGAAANMSGIALKEVAFTLEQAGKAGDLAKLQAAAPQLELEFERLREAMQA